MALLSSLADIPELLQPHVHVADEAALLRKLNTIIADGHASLQIVTDFDHTLTRHTLDNGDAVLTSFGMFRECPSVPQQYRDEDTRLCNIYKPIEADPSISVADKTQHMVEWYIAGNKMLKGVTFPRHELMDIAHKMVDSFREGVKELVGWAERHAVPLLVFSAGLGESVVAALTAADLLRPHVKVVSNFLELDGSDRIVGIKGDVIHTYNKNETAIQHTDYYEMVKDRSNVILMGDNIGDAGMAAGMAHCAAVLKVGLLGHPVQGNLPNYLGAFDVVLVQDPTLHVVNAILQRVRVQ